MKTLQLLILVRSSRSSPAAQPWRQMTRQRSFGLPACELGPGGATRTG